MRQNDLIADDVNFDALAAKTKNYTGAEIEAVCRGATSFALFKDLDMSALGKKEEQKKPDPKAKAAPKGKDQSLTERKVTMADFE
jgi:SpoVK/Ycf46/Vps4 family AAA+-type ATPase